MIRAIARRVVKHADNWLRVRSLALRAAESAREPFDQVLNDIKWYAANSHDTPLDVAQMAQFYAYTDGELTRWHRQYSRPQAN